MTATGAVRFGRYAFPPNRLGYCGPQDHQALLEYVASGSADQGLYELGQKFTGAYPYLRLIADANRIEDAFDDRVVEAYWVGNALLNHVAPAPFRESLHERFGKRVMVADFRWLETKLEQGARPHHNFHVFEVYSRAGLMHDAAAPVLVSTMDNCRISWGRVTQVLGSEVEVDRQPLLLDAGKLTLGAAESQRLVLQVDGRGLLPETRPGDDVAVHWGWACEVLGEGALAQLKAWTSRSIELANQTI